MKVMGLRPFPYWLSTLAGDVVIGLIIFGINSIPYFIVDTTLFDEMGITIHLILLGGMIFNTICLSYIYGFLFKNVNVATKAYPGIIFLSYALPLMWMLNFHREGIWNIFRWAGSIVGIMAGPSFAYYSGVLYSMPASVWA
mmetsp:Transcript_23333/g.20248  ORF Transcript_23333/g.20248 Transcript_23333/m.20248 type:complete len:141 (-) Transcript_23333:245-667(-)